MRLLLLIIPFLFMIGCASESTTDEANTRSSAIAAKVNPPAKKGTQQKLVAPKRTKKVSRDSIAPRRKNSRIMTNTSRPKNKIEQNFPYDIDLKSAEGKVFNSKDIMKPNGKPTVLLFWLTTCYPCAIEMQAIQKEFPKWKEKADFDIYAISTDFEKNYESFVKRVEDKKWPWEAFNDVNREFRQVMPGGLNGLPQTFVLDKNGNIVYHKRKYQTGDEHVLFQKIQEAAKKG